MKLEKSQILMALQEGRFQLEGQFVYGSNYTFMVGVHYEGVDFNAVYKPTRGERPLWDFPNQTLAKREVAAYIVSEALGWALVPPTVYRTQESPMGPGSAQLFIEHDPDYHYFVLKKNDQQRLPEVMAFDLVINNADRKGGHLLVDSEGELWLIDHGLSFHAEDKLRTVVWDLAGRPIPKQIITDLARMADQLMPEKSLHCLLAPYLLPEELIALRGRAERLVKSGIFPLPPEDRRATPWPLV